MSREEFLLKAISAAQAASRVSGLPAGITTAQAILESAWGRSGLSEKANNYFGIKAHGKHDVVEMQTSEVRNGNIVKTAARFASYSSMDECFADRDALILKMSVYAEARKAASDPETFARALAKHWATDPNYADKLLAIYRQHGLDSLDRS